MRANEPTWTDERIALLRSHFEAGLSCRQIAADIGVSRNAVIGKLSRLNLTRGRMIGERQASAKGAAKARRQKASPRLQYQILKAVFAGQQPAVEEAPINAEHHCSLFELSKHRCRWPINTPGHEDFCFCGNQPIDGMPYCAGHTRLAYQRVARR
ncbi:MAG TPA: GcrA family cell cycle regulator [Bradyrhizobium sp.]|nr:GcrA family cell cycle regulator [Bradyrhizobium sp.]